MHRGFSSKVPKLNNFAEIQSKKYEDDDMEDEYFDEPAPYQNKEGYHHNFHPSGAVKPVSKKNDLDGSTEEDLVRLCKDHENLIDLILEEEEEVTNSHKVQIDNEVETVKEEMKLIYEVQKPNSDIKQYVQTLHSVLDHKIRMMMELKQKVELFGEHLIQEERLSEEFKNKQEIARNQRDY